MHYSGTGDTIPFECYEDPISKLLSQAVTPILTNSSDTAVGQDWVARAGFAEQCHQPNLDTGNLIGTAYVARDMMQIVDALGEDGLLRYWGRCWCVEVLVSANLERHFVWYCTWSHSCGYVSR